MFLKNKWEININLTQGKHTEGIKCKRRRVPIKYWYRSIKDWWNELLTLKLYIDLEKYEKVSDILKVLERIKRGKK